MTCPCGGKLIRSPRQYVKWLCGSCGRLDLSIWKCSECGYAFNGEEEQFCSWCGLLKGV